MTSLREFMMEETPLLFAAFEEYHTRTGEDNIGAIREGVIKERNLSPIRESDFIYDSCIRWEKELLEQYNKKQEA